MDNVSHTLAALIAGEAAHNFRPATALSTASATGLAPASRRTAGIAVMILGNNLPDADFIYPALTGSKLDYLLQHRGHSHTIIGALAITTLLLLALWLWFRLRRQPWSRADARYLALLALLAPLLHIAMDYTNSYGVHPFWPFDNSWHYGDAVFIVEPLLWACATPLLFTLRSRLARGAIALVLLAGVGLALGTGLVPKPLVVALLLLIALLAVAGRLCTERVALATSVAAWLGLTAMFFATAHIADARIAALTAQAFPRARTLDRILTPLPANPLCREVLIVQTVGNRYVLRKALHSIAPTWLPAGACPQQVARGQSTARLTPTAATASREIAWQGEIDLPRASLPALSDEYCAVRALLRFARAPWWVADQAGWIVGDLRYDREPGLGFAEVRIGPQQDECPRLVPDWSPPRADLLGASHSAVGNGTAFSQNSAAKH